MKRSIKAFRLAGAGALLGSALATGAAAQEPVEWGTGLQGAFSPVMAEMSWFSDFVHLIMAAIVLFVTVLLGIAIVRFNRTRNPTPSKTTHNTLVEVVWTVLPVLILVVIAIPSFRILYRQQVIPMADMTVKAVGHQWYWSYEYPDHGEFSFDSLMVQQADLKPGQPRLLTADNEMVVPVGKVVRVISTSADVNHAFAMPAFGMKMDAIPGRLNEGWFRATQPGVYYGQCSELCGRDHAFMPIAIRAVSEEEFTAWVAEARQKFAGGSPARLAGTSR